MKDIEETINWYKNNGGITYKNFCDTFLPRIEIKEFLDKVVEDGDNFEVISPGAIYNHAEKIAAIYKYDKPMEILTDILEKDVLILLVYVRENKNISPNDDDLQRRIKANYIEQVLTGIIKRSIDFGIKLPQDFIEKYGNIDIRFKTFAELINNLYTGTAEQNKCNDLSFSPNKIYTIIVFDRAVKKGYMSNSNGKYIWIKSPTLLTALLGTIFNYDIIDEDGYYRRTDNIVPWKDFGEYFNLKNLPKLYRQLNKKPRGYDIMIRDLEINKNS